MFEILYNSPWHHPGAAWAAAILAPALAVGLDRRRWLGLLLLLEAAIALDAWFTGAWPPIDPASPWAVRASVAFVILGDWRFFYLVERQGRERAPAAAASLLWSLIVPAFSYLLKLGWPRAMADAHLLYFVYEISFLAVAVVTGWRVRRLAGGAVRRWLYGLVAFELVQYAGWALADAVILRGHDVGYALRIPPNVLYYAVFAPFAVFTAPPDARA